MPLPFQIVPARHDMTKIHPDFSVVSSRNPDNHVSCLAEGGVDMSQYMNIAAVLLACTLPGG
jgi:hypothetical protein